MPFSPGDTVLIRARVVNVYGAEREEAYQTYGLQLPDGQGLQTNSRNLSPDPPEEPDEGGPGAVKEASGAPSGKSAPRAQPGKGRRGV